MQRFARLLDAPTPFKQEVSAQTTAGTHALWKAAPPKHLREACAANTEHTASVLQWGAQPTLRRGAAIASHKKKVACAHPNCSTPPDPWQRFLRQARRFWDLHSLGMQNQRSIRKERTLFQAFQRQSDLLYFRLQQWCCCTGALPDARCTWILLDGWLQYRCCQRRAVQEAWRPKNLHV